MEEIEIYASDLTEQAQKRILEEMGIESFAEINGDVFPIATIPVPQTDEEDEE